MLPRVVMLVGFPASGKSSLATHVQQHAAAGKSKIVYLNQDTMGKKEMWKVFQDNIKRQDTTLLLDNTNMSKSDRQEWIRNSFGCKMWCIFMNTPLATCRYRIERRRNHPTVAPGKTGVRLLDELESKETLQVPVASEGFERVFVVTNDAELEYLLEHDLGITVPLTFDDGDGQHVIKFPRTAHLVSESNKTKDDRVLTPERLKTFLGRRVVVHEKIDGANTGITVTKDGEIRFQNRSHWICSSSDAQFKKLDKWKYRHQDELLALLEPEQEILYGEWMAHKHSIHYQQLPDYFMAFDIYNTTTKTFLSPSKLEERLQACTTICTVPVITTTTFKKIDDIKKLLQTKSQFYDGPIEGVYLRLTDDDDQLTVDRCKLVRPDFITGNQHWSKFRTENGVVNQY